MLPQAYLPRTSPPKKIVNLNRKLLQLLKHFVNFATPARGGLLYPGEAGRVLLRQPGLGLPPRKASVGPSAEVRPGVTAIQASLQMLVPSEGAQLAQLLQRQRRNARMSDFMTLSRSGATDMPSSGPVSIETALRPASDIVR